MDTREPNHDRDLCSRGPTRFQILEDLVIWILLIFSVYHPTAFEFKTLEACETARTAALRQYLNQTVSPCIKDLSK
jgi:hypothetical protein